MKILIVCRWHGNHAAGFITEQVDALQKLGHDVGYCFVENNGISGYIKFVRELRKKINSWHPNVIHAHYGICGLATNLATRVVPVVTTYPGSDINVPNVRRLSKLCIHLSAHNIFMSQKQVDLLQGTLKKDKYTIQPYGINLDSFQIIEKNEARKLFANAKPDEVKWNNNDKYVLFSSKFNRPEKDPQLALNVCSILSKRRTTHLLPLTGEYTKDEMMWLMNAVDAAIVTSKSEGSPQFTKEVMACGTPIVSVDVGDVRHQLTKSDGFVVDGYYISTNRNIDELSSLLNTAVDYGKTEGKSQVIRLGLDTQQVAEKLIAIYKRVAK